MQKSKAKLVKSLRRAKRVRSKVRGSTDAPRLSVFRSAKYIYAQLIDDVNANTLLAVDSRRFERSLSKKVGAGARKETAERRKEQMAFLIGKELGQEARQQGIKKARFDRGSYQYHGRVAKVAEGVRESGLQF